MRGARSSRRHGSKSSKSIWSSSRTSRDEETANACARAHEVNQKIVEDDKGLP